MRWSTLANTNKGQPIYITLTEEHLEDINTMKRIMGISFFGGLILAIMIGFAITMGN